MPGSPRRAFIEATRDDTSSPFLCGQPAKRTLASAHDGVPFRSRKSKLEEPLPSNRSGARQLNDNIISLDKHRQDKAGIYPASVTPSPEEAAARAAVAAQAAVDQEERSQMHLVLVDATAKVLD